MCKGLRASQASVVGLPLGQHDMLQAFVRSVVVQHCVEQGRHVRMAEAARVRPHALLGTVALRSAYKHWLCRRKALKDLDQAVALVSFHAHEAATERALAKVSLRELHGDIATTASALRLLRDEP